MKIVAKETNIKFGYIEGDVLKYVGMLGNYYRAVNLTRPELTRDQYAVLSSREFEILNDTLIKPKLYRVMQVKEIKLFGITIFKKVIKEPIN